MSETAATPVETTREGTQDNGNGAVAAQLPVPEAKVRKFSGKYGGVISALIFFLERFGIATLAFIISTGLGAAAVYVLYRDSKADRAAFILALEKNTATMEAGFRELNAAMREHLEHEDEPVVPPRRRR